MALFAVAYLIVWVMVAAVAGLIVAPLLFDLTANLGR